MFYRYRLIFSFLAVFIFAHCVSSKSSQSPEAKIIGVYSQKYRGGLKGTPSGIRYKILLIAPASQHDFNTVGFWIADQFAPATAYRNKMGVNKLLYNKGDTLTVTANFTLTAKGYASKDSSAMSKPGGFNEKVLLLYTFKSKKKYVGSNEINELEEELRP